MIFPAFTNLPNLVTGTHPFSSLSLLPLLNLLFERAKFLGPSDIVYTYLSECYTESRGGGFRSTNVLMRKVKNLALAKSDGSEKKKKKNLHKRKI